MIFCMGNIWVILRRNVIYLYSKKPHLDQLFNCQSSRYDVIRWVVVGISRSVVEQEHCTYCVLDRIIPTQGLSSCGEKRRWSRDLLKSSRFLINYLGFLITTITKNANYKLNYKNYPNIKYLLTSSWIAN